MILKRLLPSLLLATVALPLFAQNDAALVTDIVATPNYFVTVLSGVLLALGFQFLLTALSVAVGITATPNLKESYAHAKYGPSDRSDDNNKWNETNDTSNTGVVLSTAFGAWNVLTVALSLFAATVLALNITPILNPAIAVTLSLVIWAAFYMLMFWLEGRFLGTMLGSLISTATSGLRAAGESLRSMFAPSPSTEIQKVADNTIEKLRAEFSSSFDTDGINQTLENFLNKVENKTPDYRQIKQDLKEVFSEASSSGSSSPATWTAIQGVVNKVIDEGGNSNSKDLGAQFQDILDRVKSEFDLEQSQNGNTAPTPRGSRVDTPRGASVRINQSGSRSSNRSVHADLGSSVQPAAQNQSGDQREPQNGGAAAPYLQKFTDWLQGATPDSFDATRLQPTLQKLINDPNGTLRDLKGYAGQIDRSTIVNAIANNTALERSQVDGYADRVFGALQNLQTQVGSDHPSGQALPQRLLTQFEGTVRNFIDSTDDPRLNYDSLQRDFERMLNNPADSLDIIKARLNTYDRNTLVSVLTNNSRLSRSDIDEVANRVELAQGKVKDQIQQIEDTARSTMKNLERRAVIQAEHARKTALSAAWWLVATIIVSGVAAVLGGMTNF